MGLGRTGQKTEKKAKSDVEKRSFLIDEIR